LGGLAREAALGRSSPASPSAIAQRESAISAVAAVAQFTPKTVETKSEREN
jgi:hypothetical protein